MTLRKHHDNFRAMDTEIDVILRAEERPLASFLAVRLLFEQQEQRFSRFRHGSLLSQFNRERVIEDRWLAAVVRLALDANARTAGRFNPMILDGLIAAGYDRSFPDLRIRTQSSGFIASPPLNDAITLSGEKVQLLAGRLDLGGIVKGWTVDLAVNQLAAEYSNVLVNAGGDLRVTGSDDDGPGWSAQIEIPWPVGAVQLRLQAALATSSTLKRRWRTDEGANHHHLIDPASGRPSDSGIVQASVLASQAWLAEIWAKSVVIGGTEMAETATLAGLATLVAFADGSRRTFGPWPAG